jgi:hypothetical protein
MGCNATANKVTERYGALVRSYVVTPDPSAATGGPILLDAESRFARAYGLGPARTGVLIRPDGYVGYRSESLSFDGLVRHLGRTLFPEAPPTDTTHND